MAVVSRPSDEACSLTRGVCMAVDKFRLWTGLDQGSAPSCDTAGTWRAIRLFSICNSAAVDVGVPRYVSEREHCAAYLIRPFHGTKQDPKNRSAACLHYALQATADGEEHDSMAGGRPGTWVRLSRQSCRNQQGARARQLHDMALRRICASSEINPQAEHQNHTTFMFVANGRSCDGTCRSAARQQLRMHLPMADRAAVLEMSDDAADATSQTSCAYCWQDLRILP